MENLLLLAAATTYILIAFVRPTLRVRRLYGTWPIVFSREAAPAQRLLGALVFVMFGVMIVGPLVRLALDAETLGIRPAPLAVHVVGWLLLLAGATLTLVAQQHMGASWRVGIDDRPTTLVVGGVFRWIRNPIFAAVLIFLAGYACLMPAWWTFALWAMILVGLRLQIHLEEAHLIQTHGVDYLNYAALVGRLVPGIGRLRPPAGRVDANNRL